MNEPKLKQCPFCGDVSDFSEIAGMFIVRCCGCGISTKLRETLEEAAAEWNRRVKPKPSTRTEPIPGPNDLLKHERKTKCQNSQ